MLPESTATEQPMQTRKLVTAHIHCPCGRRTQHPVIEEGAVVKAFATYSFSSLFCDLFVTYCPWALIFKAQSHIWACCLYFRAGNPLTAILRQLHI